MNAGEFGEFVAQVEASMTPAHLEAERYAGSLEVALERIHTLCDAAKTLDVLTAEQYRDRLLPRIMLLCEVRHEGTPI